MAEINRIFWMLVFLLGAAVFGWLSWQDNSSSTIAWFMLTSLWSAVCAIAYTVLHWFLVDKKSSG
jgi:predicted membrane protein